MFAPVVKLALLHVFLAICALEGWNVQQMDIKSAYLNVPITEDIYMSQPKGFEEVGRETLVAKLNKGLYGLKQAGREWYGTLRNFLISIGFRWTHADHSVFVFERGSSIIIIPVYVDDKLLAGNDERALDSIQAQISTCFKASNLGTTSWILGIWVLSRTVTPPAYSDTSHVLFRLTPTSSHALLLVTRTTPVDRKSVV